MSQTYTLQSVGGNFATDTFVSGGTTITGGTFVAAGDTLIIPAGSGNVTTSLGGTLTISGAVDLLGAGTTLTLDGGLTGAGTIGVSNGATLAGPVNSLVQFDPSGGTFIQNQSGTFGVQTTVQAGETYILQTGITLQTTGNTTGLISSQGQGTILNDADVVIDGGLTTTNFGVLFRNGGTLSVGSTGTIASGGASTGNRDTSVDPIIVINAGRLDGDNDLFANTTSASFAAIALDQPTPPYSGTALLVINTGLITDELVEAITVRASAASTIVNQAGGTIAAKTTLQDAIDIYNGTVTNFGTIAGGAGANAVSFSGAGDSFIIGGGGTIGGDVIGTGPSLGNTLGLAGDGTLTTTSQYIDFGTLAVESGADWLIGSASSIAGISSIVDYGTLQQTGSGVSALFIDQGGRDTVSAAGLTTLAAGFGTLGTALAPNILDLSNTGATSFAGTISNFGVNDQVDLGHFAALPSSVSITAASTTGSIGPVTITGLSGVPASFILDNFTLAAGQTIGPELVGNQILGRNEFFLASTSSGIALEAGMQTVTLNANPDTLAAGQTLSVTSNFAVVNVLTPPSFSNQGSIIGNYVGGGYNGAVRLTGGAYTLGSRGASLINGSPTNASALISGARYGVDFEAGSISTSAQLTNFGTIQNNGGAGAGGFNAAAVFGINTGGSVTNSGLINGRDEYAVYFKTDLAGTAASVVDLVTNTGTLESQAGNASVVVHDSLAQAYVLNSGLITNGVVLRALAGAGTISNAGTIGTIGGINPLSNVSIEDQTRGVLNLDPGQSLDGGIATFGAGSALELSGTPGSAGTLANPASYIGFTSLTLETGADWRLGGAVSGVSNINDFGTLDLPGLLPGTSIDMEGSIANSAAVVDFTGTDSTTPLYDFAGNDAIVLGGSILPTPSAGSSFTDSYNTATGVLTTSEINAAGSVIGTATVTVTGTAALSAASFIDIAGPGGVSIVSASGVLSSSAGSITIDHGEHVTLANTAGVDTIPVTFGTHGTSLSPNVLELNGTVSATSSPYTGPISGFGLNDDIILGPRVLPSVAFGSQVTLGYAGSLLTVAELNSAGTITASTTLDVGTGYSAASFVALLGTGGVNIETPATVDETKLTFTGTTGSIASFEDPTHYAGGLAPGATVVAGETVIVASGTASISSTSPVTNDGTIIITGSGTTLLDGAHTPGNGTVSLTSGGTLVAGGSFGGGTIDMGGGSAGTMLDITGSALAGGTLGATIVNFGTLDTIMLSGFTATSSTFVPGTGLEISNGTVTETIVIAGSFGAGMLGAEAVPGGTDILLCYLEGTRILTPMGEIAVESLNIGDPVVTRFGGYRPIKWIGRQSFAKRFAQRNRQQMPVRIAGGALGPDLPKRDLFVSPGHSMLLGGLLVLAEGLVNGITITQGQAPEDIHYYQLEFETHDCVLAEGVWSESFADGPGLRAAYHNEPAFYDLYPDHVTPDTIAMCAPRPPGGPALEAVMRAVLAEVKIPPPGPLAGYIDHAGGTAVEGWALDTITPDLPVLLEVSVAGEVLGTVLACGYRADLAAAGLGAGWCQFEFTLPAGLSLAARRALQIRRLADNAQIPMSPACETALGMAHRRHAA